jgi:hypothetical protein
MPFLFPARAAAILTTAVDPTVQRRRRASLSGLGAAAQADPTYLLWRGGRINSRVRPGPGLIPAGSPVTPTATPAPPISVAGTPVPVGFSTNQLFMAPDGSQWAYSIAQGRWINVGTPYNLSAPSASVTPVSTSTLTTAPPPVSVSVAAPAAAPSAYQSVIDFATSNSMLGVVPNWVVGAGLLIGLKWLESSHSSAPRGRNPRRQRRRR